MTPCSPDEIEAIRSQVESGFTFGASVVGRLLDTISKADDDVDLLENKLCEIVALERKGLPAAYLAQVAATAMAGEEDRGRRTDRDSGATG